ncbi:N-methylhydantoinase A [Rhodoblastus acidophilus]|uniref:hydantoinase/oxoprolinase family protein n=1 Tax=Rhodoblastus acidophilus TaxID=1074 RepID=UPI00222490B3|nr:hydantoinase/oxoprolinase family protein [Rhodoblastus acidophilus]MCW2318661.1 N-methylhydantoinase A [Rhodoblastus acidophilus]
MLRIGIDIGGTFTDFAVWNSEAGGYRAIEIFKVPSTPPHFEEGVKTGVLRLLEEGKVKPDDEVLIVHGTTVTTNAVIERKGAPVALLVTQGCKNILDIARLRMGDPIDLRYSYPLPITPNALVFEIHERLRANGDVERALREEDVAQAATEARAAGAQSIAVCFLHSYRNAVHEMRAAEIVRSLGLDLDVVLSHEIWAQEGEYERANAALLNAFARGAMRGYVTELELFLAQRLPKARLMITKSNGGAMNALEAAVHPIHSLLSGPASGVTAAATLGALLDAPNLLTMDMGGTSTDISIVRDGAGIVSQQGKVGDFPIIMPVVAIEAIGAGGGSIAWMDGNVLKVGPHSAGARPGPACYGQGGVLPTLSDAYLLCGYLSESTPLAGGIVLRRDLAEQAMQPIADRLGVDLTTAAESCILVATSNMLAKALPFIARIGVSPADLTLMIFGGAGAIHGPLLASEIGIGRIIVPKTSSVFCAYGGLVTDLLYDAVVSTRGQKLSGAAMRDAFSGMRVSAAEWLGKQAPSILPEYEYSANVRYVGQSFDVATALDADTVETGDVETLARNFHREHQRLFLHAHPDGAIEAVSFQLRIRGVLPRPRPEDDGPEWPSADVPQDSLTRKLFINGQWHVARHYDQDSLGDDWGAAGPAVIEQATATTIAPPGFQVKTTRFGDLVMEKVK